MKASQLILLFYTILLLLSNIPVSDEIEICKIGGKQHICGKGLNNRGYVDDINVEYFSSCATLEEADGYSCLCVRITSSGIWNHRFQGYDLETVQDYNTKYLSYQIDPSEGSNNEELFNKCYIGRDCSDITDKSLCESASQCIYKNGYCRAVCSNHQTQDTCERDSSCRYNKEKNYCTNSSILLTFKYLSIIMISLFLI